MTNTQYVKKFELNQTGRDYVVGDIHGCFDQLHTELEGIGFDRCHDRLFSVGDLVDRGPSSTEAIDWIAEPWFHAVRGNHEQIAIGVAQGKHDRHNYLINGGGWFLELDHYRQSLIAGVFSLLPVCIQVQTSNGSVGIVHADIVGSDWNNFIALLESDLSNTKRRDLLETALWSRERIRSSDGSMVNGVDRIYVGHTPVRSQTVLGNVHYIDTGAVFGNKLTVVSL